MDFSLDWEKGKVVTNNEIMDKFKCGLRGGIRRSLKTNTLVLVSDKTKCNYEDATKNKDNVWNFSGMGYEDQIVTYKQNQTLFSSFQNGIKLYLFIKTKKDSFVFIDEVINLGYPKIEKRIVKNQEIQKIFFQLIEIGNSKNPSEFLNFIGKEQLKKEKILNSHNDFLNLHGISNLVTLMKQYNVDCLLNRGSWFLNKNGYFINRFDSNKEQIIKKIENNSDLKSVYHKQNKFINPFYKYSLVKEEDFENKIELPINSPEIPSLIENQKLVLGVLDLKLNYFSTNICFFDLNQNHIERNKNRNQMSIFIGKNGVGKSLILSSLQKIFLDLIKLTKGIEGTHTRKFDYVLSYKLGSNIYSVKKEKKDYTIKRNHSEINMHDLQVPDNIISCSFSYNDRFISNSMHNFDDINSYVGFKINKSANINDLMIQNIMYGSLRDSNFFRNLSKITTFLGFKNELKIELTLKLKENESIDEFINNNSRLKKKNATEPTEWFDLNEDKNHLNFLNKLISSKAHTENVVLFKEPNIIEVYFDFSQHNNYENLIEIFEMLQYQINQNFYSRAQIKLKKDNDWVVLEEHSSGEFQYIFTMISILARIKKNSLILIDEPETSLHPNWQYKYLSVLDEIFSEYQNVHFIFATHSHFIISDFRNEQTSLIKLEKTAKNMVTSSSINESTYGKSAEELLYEIFDLPTSRNYYLAKDVDEIIVAISQEAVTETIIEKTKRLGEVYTQLKKSDPLRGLISKIHEKVTGIKLIHEGEG